MTLPVEQEAKRVPGQDFGQTGPVFAVPEHPRTGHRSDHDSYTRTRKKTYLRKVQSQKNRKKA